jgi:uncharacterized protein YjbI with pentapeptide repeats
MADVEQLALLEQGVTGWNEWRKKNLDARINLSGANLNEAILSSANLRRRHSTNSMTCKSTWRSYGPGWNGIRCKIDASVIISGAGGSLTSFATRP